MLKSVWTSGIWKPLVHTMLEDVLYPFLLRNKVEAYFFNYLDKLISVWTSGFRKSLVHLISERNAVCPLLMLLNGHICFPVVNGTF